MSMRNRTNPLVAFAANVILERLGIGGGQDQAPANQEREIGDLSSIAALRRKDGSVTVIIGRRESGKTVLSYRLAELLGHPVYAVTPEEAPPKGVIELDFEELEDMPPPRSTLILDDIPVYASQRDYSAPAVRTLEKIIPMVRHRRKLHLICSTQSSGLSDRFIMDADMILLKPANLLFSDLERPAVARYYKQFQPIFDRMSERQRLRHVAVISHSERGIVRVNLPSPLTKG